MSKVTYSEIFPEGSVPVPALGYADALSLYVAAGSASVLRPIPVATTPPRGFQRWTLDDATRWARSEHWMFARTASCPAPGWVFLDDDSPELVAALTAELGPRPSTLCTTSRGEAAARDGRAKRLYRVPAGVTFADRYSGGEIVDSVHRFAFIGPTRNAKTAETEEWYSPDGSALDRVPTLDDLTELVAELPAAWVEHLTRAPRSVTAPLYSGPSKFDAGDAPSWLMELAETWGDPSHYPDAQAALWGLAGVAVMLPDTPGLETLREGIVAAYVNRPNPSSTADQSRAALDRAWAGALAKKADERRELESEVGSASVAWALMLETSADTLNPRAELERLSNLTPEQAEAEFGWNAQDLHAQALSRAEGAVKRAELTETASQQWDGLDLGPVLSGEVQAIRPTILRREDGHALLYPGSLNEIHAEGSSGKTWIALAACAEVLADGGSVLYLDYEETPARMVERLRLLGVSDAQLGDRNRFRYVQPEGNPMHAEERLRALAALGWTLVVFDTLNESLGSVGGDSNTEKDITAWARFPRLFAAAGSCVLTLDHITKDGKNVRYSTGSQAKRSITKGAMFWAKVKTAPVKGGAGVLELYLTKDNGSGVAEHCPAPTSGMWHAGDFHLDSRNPSRTEWKVSYATTGVMLAALSGDYAERRREVIDALTAAGEPVAKSALRRALKYTGNNMSRHQSALDGLIEEGTVVLTPGPRSSTLLSLRPSPSPGSKEPVEGGEGGLDLPGDTPEIPSRGRSGEGGEGRISPSPSPSPSPRLDGEGGDPAIQPNAAQLPDPPEPEQTKESTTEHGTLPPNRQHKRPNPRSYEIKRKAIK